jgi:Lrp/AsnC family transcriptional regulator, regulator for asnA, asnC and gidA
MDELDHKIVKELQINPRISYANLATSLGTSEATISRRIEHLISSGTVVFTALPDMKRFGYPIRVYIGLRVERPSILTEITKQICQFNQVRFICSCEGFEDIFIRGEFKSNEDLNDFIINHLCKIDGISNIDTMIELQQIKSSTFGRTEIQKVNNINTPPTIHDIDEIDRRLVIELQKNCRTPANKLALIINMDESTVHRRINKLISSGAVILTVTPNIGKATYSSTGFIFVEAELPEIASVADALAIYHECTLVGIYSGPVRILAGNKLIFS